MKARMKEIFEKVGMTVEYRAKKLKQGLDLSIPEINEEMSGYEKMEAMKNADIRAGVACISEANKMEGVYAAEKHAVLVEESTENKVSELISEYEKEF